MTGDGPVGVGVRRVPGLDLGAPLPASEPRLLGRIVAEIRDGGPMTFARFMELALYDPESGYYAAERDDASLAGPGREADFLTAPESHPIFGWAIARQLEEAWNRLGRPDRFVVREHGAGTGAMAVGILDGLRRSASPLLDAIRYQAFDVAASRLTALNVRLDAASLSAWLDPPGEAPAPGAVLANELLDALPVHRVEGASAGDPRGPVLERLVDLDADGALTTIAAAPKTAALAARLAGEDVHLEPGQAAEICLGVDDWVRAATTPLAAGPVLLIDYGAPATRLYAPSRGSTLRAYHRHRVHGDRPAGPHGPCRSHGRRARGPRRGPDEPRPGVPVEIPREPRDRRAAGGPPVGPGDDPRVVPGRPLRGCPDARPAGHRRICRHGLRPGPACRATAARPRLE